MPGKVYVVAGTETVKMPELIGRLTKRLGTTSSFTHFFLKELTKEIWDCLMEGKRVKLANLAIFEPVVFGEHTCSRAIDGELIRVKAKRSVKVRPSVTLRRTLGQAPLPEERP